MKFTKYKSLIENSLSLVLLKSIDLGLTIVLIPYLIFKVGLHNYGVYAFAISFSMFFVNVLNYGFNLSTVREIAKCRKDNLKINKLFNEVLSVKMVLFLIILFIMVGMVFIIPSIEKYKSIFLFSTFLLLADLFSIRWFFYGMEKMKYITIISFIGNFIYVSLVLCFIKQESDFIFIPVFEAIGIGIVTIFGFFIVVKKYNFKIKLLPLLEVCRYLKNNFVSFVNLLLPSTYTLIIIFVVGLIGTPVQVTFIQLGAKFTALFSTMITILSNAVYPFINRKNTRMIMMRKLILFLGIGLSVLMYLSSESIVVKWLKLDTIEEMSNTINIFKLLSISPFLISIVLGFGVNGLLIFYKDAFFSKITLLSTLVMIISAIFLVPLYPILGSAMAFVFGKVIYGLFSFIGFIRFKLSSSVNI